MKVNILPLLFGLFFGTMAMAQVKIGDNPQNIGAASVLELESSTRALVITRVTTVQMNAIVPLEGAMVYNTDAQCIYYYNGTEWLNLCDALNNSISISLTDNGNGTYTFTDAQDNTTEILVRNQSLVVEDGNLILTEADGNQLTVALNSLNTFNYTTLPLQYTDAPPNTVVITPDETGTIFNFEVGIINGENIQEGSITQTNLGLDAVGRSELADNAVGTMEINNDAVTALKINEDVAGTGLRQAANGALEVDIENIQGDGTLTTGNGALLVTGTPANALLADVELAVRVDNATVGIDPTTGLEVRDNGITNLQMGDLSIGTAELINDAVTSAKIAPNTITAADINTGAVTADEILDGTVATADIADDAITLPKLANGTATGQIMQWNGTQWALINLSEQSVTEVDGAIGNEVTNATVDGGLIRAGAGNTADPWTLGVAAGGIGTDELATDAVTSDKIDDETIVNADVAIDAEIEGTKIDPDFGNQAIITTGTLAAANTTIGGTLAITGVTTINAATAESFALPAVNGDLGQVLTTDGAGATAWSTVNTLPELLDAQIIVANGTTPSAVAMSGDATILNTGVVTIANDAVTLAKLDNGTADGQIMKWNGTDWVLQLEGDAIVGNEVVNATPNMGLIRSGTGTEDDQFTLGVNTGNGLVNHPTDGTLELFHGTPNQILRTNAVGDAAEWATIPTVVATGKIDPISLVERLNGATVTVNSTGNYTVNLSTPRLTPDYIIQLTLLGVAAGTTIQVTGQTINDFTVQIFDTDGNPIDAAWYFTVTDF
tara:strand:- start:64533 stop:66881 length:2349 start_codon:yes stop_codon:yes gene_type:complete